MNLPPYTGLYPSPYASPCSSRNASPYPSPSASPSTSPYKLRTSTQSNTRAQQAKGTQIKKARQILPLSATASLISGPNHDCTVIDRETTKLKAQNRLIYSYLRMTISRAWDCKTSRGGTELQGYSSTCGNCQSAHWALTPNLLDDKMARIFTEIKGNGVLPPNGSPGRVKYLRNTLNLTEEEIKELDKHCKEEEFIQAFFNKHLTAEQWKHSFKGTALEQQFNGVCEGPTASNNVDSRLEFPMRKKEDELCKRVEAKEIHPKEGIKLLAESLIEFFAKALENLEKREEELKEFFSLETAINSFEEQYLKSSVEEIPDEEYEQHVVNLGKIVALRKNLKTSLPGAPKYKEVDKHRSDYYNLLLIVKNLEEIKKSEKPISESKKYFLTFNFKRAEIDHAPVLLKYKNLYNEIVFQLQATTYFTESDNIDRLDCLLFGVFDSEKKERVETTTPEKKDQLYDLTKKIESESEGKGKRRGAKQRRLDFAEN